MAVACTAASIALFASVPQARAVPSAARPSGLLRSAVLKRPLVKVPGGGAGAVGRAVPKPVKEIVADRTATSSTWLNSNGSLTVRRYLTPQFYKSSSGSWLPVDPVLAATGGKAGWWHAEASSLPVSFGPAGAPGGAEQVSAGGAVVGFAPLGVSDRSLAPQVAGATATYAGLWPDTVLSEQAGASQVSEDIVLTGPSAPAEFGFRLTGGTARPDGAGGLSVSAGGRQVGVIPPLKVTVLTPPALRADLPAVEDVTAASGARLSVDGDVVRITVSKSWLVGLPSSELPAVIDPSFGGVVGQAETVSVCKSCTGHSLGVMENGYDALHDKTWRSAVYIPAPALQQEPGDFAPWQLSTAGFTASCVQSADPCGTLSGVRVGGLALGPPPGTFPTYEQISGGQDLFADADGGLQVVLAGDKPGSPSEASMVSYMRGRSGWWFGIEANDSSGPSFEFDLSQVYVDLYYVQQPAATTITSPASGSVVATATPALTAAPVPGEELPVLYDFRISTGYGGGVQTGTVIDSGWQEDLTTWTVPAGSLHDGVTYWATVQDAISQQWDLSDPGYVPAVMPQQAVEFTVRERLGGGGPSPADTVGSPPQGTSVPAQGAPSPGASTASETVNMVTGNLAVAVGTPQMQALAGPAGITLAYNSQTAQAGSGTSYGLTGQYYPDDGSHAFTGTLAGQRTDPGVDADWGWQPPIGGLTVHEPFEVRWTGQLTLPPGTWQLGGLTTGGMRVYLTPAGGARQAAWDDWAGTPATVPAYGTAAFAGGAAYQIEVDDWDTSQSGQTTVQLWAKNTAVTDPSQPDVFLVPGTWLTVAATGVPPGWSLLADPGTVTWARADDQGDQVTLEGTAGHTATFFRAPADPDLPQPAEVYAAPPGDHDLLTADGAGRLELATSGGQLYAFNADGTLASMTTVADDRHPASLQYAYSGSPAVLRSVTDPVSGRAVTLSYYGDSGGECPGTGQAPGMLCRIGYWDGTAATFAYNGNGQLSAVTSPGGQVSSFGYDAQNRLADIRDALASAWVAAGGQPGTPAACATGTGIPVAPADTQVCYDGVGRVASVTQPAPAPGAARPQRIYTYGSGQTQVSVAGFAPASGYAEKVSYDAQGRITSQADAAGHATATVWANAPKLARSGNGCTGAACGADEPIVTVSADGEQTSTVYDALGQATGTWGPAPPACFAPGGWPSGVTPPAGPVTGYLPVADPQGTPGCGVAVPRARTGYDEGVGGLAVTAWANGQFAGPAARHATSTFLPQPASFCAAGTLCAQWNPGDDPPVPAPAGGQWSMRLAGLIDIPADGAYGFTVTASQPLTLSVDGNYLYLQLPGYDEAFQDGQQNTAYIGLSNGYSFTAGPHQIEVDFQGTASQLSDFSISYYSHTAGQTYPGQPVPDTVLDPGYGLATSTTDPDGDVTATSYAGGGLDPAYGLPASVTADPGGLDLTTATSWETPGPGSYLRKLSTTLPGGNTTTYSYYAGTAGPVAAACGVTAGIQQGGQLESETGPAPGPGQPGREQQFIYDADGRQAGVRTGPADQIGAQPWACTAYDSAGRMAAQSWPATATAPARTVTYTYGVGGNPLVSTVADASGTITSTVDLLGRVVSYTDTAGQTTTTSYDQAGRVTATTGPAGTTATSYDPDTSQPLATTLNGTALATASYDPATGRLTGVAYSNGTTASTGYDAYGNQDSLQFTSTAAGTLIAGDQVTYDPGGQITTEKQGADGGPLANPNPSGGTDYAYDAVGRLVSAWLPGGTQAAYNYGPEDSGCPAGTSPNAGANTNRTSVTLTPASGSPATTSYCYNSADQLTATIAGGTATSGYAYDGHGSQTSDGATTLTWDASDRDTTITTAGGPGTTTLAYDAVSRVITRDTAGTTTGWWYAGYTDSPAGTLNSAGQVTQAFLTLPGGVTLTVQSAGDIWSYPDLHGNTTVTTTSSGTPQGSPARYDPWGQLLTAAPAANAAGGSDLGAYGTQGKITDTASGIITMGARPYNPAQARFLSVDPVQGGCANPYTYAYGEPLTSPDFTGKQDCAEEDNELAKDTSWDIKSNAEEITISIGVEAPVAIQTVTWGGFAIVNGETKTSIGSYAPSLGCLILADFGKCDLESYDIEFATFKKDGASLTADEPGASAFTGGAIAVLTVQTADQCALVITGNDLFTGASTGTFA